MKDPIVEKLHNIRRSRAARFGFDADAIYRDASLRTRAEKRKLFSVRKGKPIEVKS